MRRVNAGSMGMQLVPEELIDRDHELPLPVRV